MPRGGVSPRYCAVCGHLLAVPPDECRYARKPPGHAPPAATAALILGLCSFVPLCGLPLGVLAIALGATAKDRIKKSGGQLGGNGMATAGIVLGIITSVLWTLFCLGLL